MIKRTREEKRENSFLSNKMDGRFPLPCCYRTLTVAIDVWEPPVEAPWVGL